jgi:hypothetical protein
MSDTQVGNASPGTATQNVAFPFTPKPPFFFELSRLMVVAINTSGRLVYKAQTKPNGPWEANWTTIDNARTYAGMAAGLTGDGRAAVVAQPTSPPGPFYIDEKPNTLSQEWNTPFNLGSPAGSPAGFNFLALAFDAEGRVEVFGTGANDNIWWKYQNPNQIVQKTVRVTPPGTHTPIDVTVDVVVPPATPWSDWFQIPGQLREIKALRNADGRIILFGINAAGHLYRNEQKVARALQPSDWAGWVQMDDQSTGTFLSGTMAPSVDRAGAVNLFVINFNNFLLHTRQAPPCTATWAGWSAPGIMRNGIRAVAAGIDGDAHLVVVATDTSLLQNMTMQLDVEAQQWSAWTAVSSFSGAPPRNALDYNADGRLTLFSHLPPGSPPPNAGGLWLKSQMAFDSTEWEWAWTVLAPDSIRQYAVVRDLTPPT